VGWLAAAAAVAAVLFGARQSGRNGERIENMRRTVEVQRDQLRAERPPAMVDPTLLLPGLSPIEGKEIVARFDGGRLSSDGWSLREIERRLGVADRLTACIDDPRDPGSTVHLVADIIRFRILMIAAGYEDGRQRRDRPARPSAVQAGARSYAVGPRSVSAVDHLATGKPSGCADAAALGPGSGRRLLQFVPPNPVRILLDIDDTFAAAPGGQQMRLFNAHYYEYGFQPLLVVGSTRILSPSAGGRTEPAGSF
jgi:hypothetical protein